MISASNNTGNSVLKFPEGFLWGTSTSAYQIEGDNHNDWSEWEKSDKRKKWLVKNKKKPNDYICGSCCHSYYLYEKDLDLAKSLNNNAFRLSLEWSRLQPKPDTWNVGEIEHYRKVLQAAKERGLKTVVTLWHWTNPIWLAKEDGWAGKNVVKYYMEFVSLIIQELGGFIDVWVTLNEPEIHILNGYVLGKFPPAHKNIFKLGKVYKNLSTAHRNAYQMIHKHFPDAQVGLTMIINYVEPARKWFFIEAGMAKFVDYFFNKRFLRDNHQYMDYIGIDYYFHDRIVWYPPFKKNLNRQITDIGWEIYPEGIYQIAKDVSKYEKPIIIMENGLADAGDTKRIDFIKEHLRYLHQAISEGANVVGYFHWSLLDNFEWDKGWPPKFGLFAVDRQTFERTQRPSAAYYAEICKNNSLTV